MKKVINTAATIIENPYRRMALFAVIILTVVYISGSMANWINLTNV